MNHQIKIKIISVCVGLLLFIVVKPVEAAILKLVPSIGTAGIGQEITVDIKVDIKNESINAAQATLYFPPAILQVLSVDKSGSAFDFWVEEPVFSNNIGTVTFIGGTSKEISGTSIHVLKIKFKATGSGTANLSVSDAAVTATDGKGTNVLSEAKETSIVIGTKIVQSAVEKPIEQPQKVERAAVKATGLPAKPMLRVPTYSDQSRWYNNLGEVTVFWDLPPDVIQVSTGLGHGPEFKNGEKGAELFTGKSFGVLKEGVWYIGAQFKNNIGWGEVSYYKISLDTTPPALFEIKIDNKVKPKNDIGWGEVLLPKSFFVDKIDSEASDDPSLKINYETSDSLSGLSGYSIFIDGRESIQTTSTASKLPPQSLGKHLILVRASDLAGNSTQDSLEFEVLPLPTPTLDFITQSVRQGEFVFVSGKTIPNGLIKVLVVDRKDRQVFNGEIVSDSVGHWNTSIKEPLALGKYFLSATVRDERGATSFATKPLQFKVRPATIISLGFIDLGWLEILIVLVLLVASGTSIIGWYYVSKTRTREAYRVIIGRDIDKISAMLSGYLKDIDEIKGLSDPSSLAKMSVIADKMKDVIHKMNKYLKQEVEKL